jgi:hypothetical protein
MSLDALRDTEKMIVSRLARQAHEFSFLALPGSVGLKNHPKQAAPKPRFVQPFQTDLGGPVLP